MSDTIETALGHEFVDRALLETALTHRSWSAEQGGADNERLEFLGDAVLSACTTRLVVDRFPSEGEGALSRIRSRLVNTETLAVIGRELGIGAALRLGRGELATGGREKTSLLADATEALLGALFLDADFAVCLAVVARWMSPRLDALEQADRESTWKDPRSRLQERVQQHWRITPTYELLATEGPPHAPTFQVAVCMGEQRLGTGSGPTKREAAQRAAHEALQSLSTPAEGEP